MLLRQGAELENKRNEELEMKLLIVLGFGLGFVLILFIRSSCSSPFLIPVFVVLETFDC